MSSPSELLRKAKSNVEVFGWFQGDYLAVADDKPGVCGCCALGALRLADIGYVEGTSIEPSSVYTDSYGGSTYRPSEAAIFAESHLERAINATERYIAQNIPDWNDRPTRTKNEVLHAFDRAIELAEEAGQ